MRKALTNLLVGILVCASSFILVSTAPWDVLSMPYVLGTWIFPMGVVVFGGVLIYRALIKLIK